MNRNKHLGTIFNDDCSHILRQTDVPQAPMTPRVYEDYVEHFVDLRPIVRSSR